MNDTLVAKIVSMCLLGGVSLIVALVPIKIVEKIGTKAIDEKGQGKKFKLFLTALNCFGAGVILTTSLTHMLPETNEILEANYRDGSISNSGLPLGEILLICGFLMIYVIEEVAHVVLDKIRKKPDKNAVHPHLGGDYNHEEIPNNVLADLGNKASFQAAFRGFFVILAISLHAVFEGVAMGLVNKASGVWSLCFAVAAHKFIISFCLGMQMASSGMKKLLIFIYMGTFSIMTPIGIGIGIALIASQEASEFQDPAVSVLNGLAAGTLVYVVFFEVLEKERQEKTSGLLQVSFIVLGFVTMILVSLLEGEHHHHGGHHDDHHGDHHDESFCSLDLEEVFANFSSGPRQINITCLDGNFTIV